MDYKLYKCIAYDVLLSFRQDNNRILIILLRLIADQVAAVFRNEAGNERISFLELERMFGIWKFDAFRFPVLLVVADQIRLAVQVGCQI